MNSDVKAIVATGYAEHVRDVGMSKLLLEAEIEHLQRQLEPSGINYGDKVSVSPTMDTIPDGVAKLIQLQDEYETTIAEYAAIIREAHNALLNIDVVPRTALTQHYILLKSWEEVCVEMGYTYDGVMKLRKRGLIALYDFIPGEYRAVLPKTVKDTDITWPTAEEGV